MKNKYIVVIPANGVAHIFSKFNEQCFLAILTCVPPDDHHRIDYAMVKRDVELLLIGERLEMFDTDVFPIINQ